jgi:hypothetical protein
VVRERAQKLAMLRHPTDGIQWRNFNWKHKDFAVEVRNSREELNYFVSALLHIEILEPNSKFVSKLC